MNPKCTQVVNIQLLLADDTTKPHPSFLESLSPLDLIKAFRFRLYLEYMSRKLGNNTTDQLILQEADFYANKSSMNTRPNFTVSIL